MRWGNILKRAGLVLALAALAAGSSACAALIGSQRTDVANDSVFELRIHIDKDEYTAWEAVPCYATLEYVGGADSITINSSDPLVYFTVKGSVFKGDYAVNDVLVATTFAKGEPVRFEFAKSGGYSENDRNAEFWKSWFADPELKLPAGDYTISATLSGRFEGSDVSGPAYTLTASQRITVTEPGGA
jgi:hypothetical protein